MNERDALSLAYGVIIAGFEQEEGYSALLSDLQEYGMGGVVFFKRNAPDPKTLADFIQVLKEKSGANHLLYGIDQEGGRVVRLREPLTVLPPARVLGQIGDEQLTYDAGYLVGMELCALGLNVNFAPVLDVDTNPNSPIIGDRSFGDTPQTVIKHGLSFARGLRDAGVLPVAKHFPGHGDADLDSHLQLPTVSHSESRLKEIEMAPFKTWCDSKAGAIMSAHVHYPALDGKFIGTTSKTILNELLRNQMGFEGVVFSDDMEMGAVGEENNIARQAILAIEAGIDGLLICRQTHIRRTVAKNLALKAKEDSTFATRLADSGKRLKSIASSLHQTPDFAWIGSDEHLKLADKVKTRIKNFAR